MKRISAWSAPKGVVRRSIYTYVYLGLQSFFVNKSSAFYVVRETYCSDGEGFEPPVSTLDTSVFKTDTFNRSDIHPALLAS